MNQISPEVHESTLSMVMGLTLNHLKNVARHERLPVSGTKAVLQGRIKDKLSEYARKSDSPGFFRLRYLVEHPESTPPAPSTFGTAQPPSMSVNQYGSGPSRADTTFTNGAIQPMRLIWKPSPFYHVQQPITSVQECKVRESTRDSFECKIRLEPDVIDKFSNQGHGQDYRLMVYCAVEPVSAFTPMDITFPQSIEVKVNGNEVKANLRGLKNKPGSTRPADITNMIHKKPNYTNILTVTYALTHKRYYLVVNLVRKISSESLVGELKSRPVISKDRVIRDRYRPSSYFNSHVLEMSLVDPTDGDTVQEQAPTWTCPICGRSAGFDTILIDGYVSDILESSSRAVEQVTIEPSGVWKPVSSEMSQSQGQRSASDDAEEDDDLIEIQEPPRIGSVRQNASLTPSNVTRTPPQSSREESITTASVRSSGSKRPASAIIDLTLSSEDEEPPRPAKRQSIYPLPPQSAQPFHSGDYSLSNNARPGALSFSMQKPTEYPRPPPHNPLGR